MEEELGEPVDYKNWPANNILDVSKVKVTDTTETNPFASYIPLEGTKSCTE